MPETEELLRSNSRASQYLEDWTPESSCPGPEPAAQPMPHARPGEKPKTPVENSEEVNAILAKIRRLLLARCVERAGAPFS